MYSNIASPKLIKILSASVLPCLRPTGIQLLSDALLNSTIWRLLLFSDIRLVDCPHRGGSLDQLLCVQYTFSSRRFRDRIGRPLQAYLIADLHGAHRLWSLLDLCVVGMLKSI